MNNQPTEVDFYCDFLKREIPLLEGLLYNTDIEAEAGYEYAVLKLNMHFASRFDSDEIRDILAQNPEETEAPHSLASLYLAQAAYDLQTRLIENSCDATGGLIGPIIGVEAPQNPASDIDLPPRSTVKTFLALYRTLPEDKRAAFGAVVASKMEPG